MKRFAFVIPAAFLAACSSAPAVYHPIAVPPEKAAAHPTTPTPPVAAAPKELLSPDLRKAIEGINSSDASQRDAALAVLRHALAENPADGNARLREELRLLATATGLEAKARAAAVLDLNQGLARFTMEAIALPAAERDPLMTWAFSDEGMMVTSQAFSPDPATRIRAAQNLVFIPGPHADWILGHLVEDFDRETSLVALDVAGDRTPTAELVDALFNKAIYFNLRQYGVPLGPEAAGVSARQIDIHGHPTTIVKGNQQQQTRQLDGQIATEILITWNNPLVIARLDRFFTELKTVNGSARYRILASYNGNVAVYVTNLLEAYRPKTLVAFVAKGVFAEPSESFDVSINGVTFHGSTRLDAMAIFLDVTSQDPADYGLVRVPQYGNRWLIQGNAAAEGDAVKKIDAWCKKNGDKYGIKQ